MRALTRGTTTAIALVVAFGMTSGAAEAKGPGASEAEVDTSGMRSGSDLVSMIRYTSTTTGGKGKGNVTPVGNWTPPACWYEPRSAEEFSKYVENMYDETVNAPGQHSYAKSAVGMFRNEYKDGKYKNYNLDKKDEGNWWVAVRDEDRWTEPEAQLCDKQPFWVENGATPPVENAVTPQVLAELAYNRIQLPTTEVTLAPEATTKVNLPTWAWLDKARFKEVSVTAALNVGGLNIQATTTAKPVSLKLEPGTPDAETYPASGECTINDDGSIGEPYAKGKANQTPPCGIRYLRSSGDGTFKLQATVTWDITWTGTGNPNPTQLPNGTFGNAQNVTVQEIQSVNR
ncbi:hypothetical protein GCM10010383_22540 [Streptomyces lomondensis]|uniref:Secreted protein n=2 Tax=Streptomyces lomondensis TaxID=68229 RepID=A0ABQ2X1N9_9ACTN|nr:hypothetical protein GCM10010383_22540 [Streptomyces lomondensis]